MCTIPAPRARRHAAAVVFAVALATAMTACGASGSSAPTKLREQVELVTPSPAPTSQVVQPPCPHRPCAQ